VLVGFSAIGPKYCSRTASRPLDLSKTSLHPQYQFLKVISNKCSRVVSRGKPRLYQIQGRTRTLSTLRVEPPGWCRRCGRAWTYVNADKCLPLGSSPSFLLAAQGSIRSSRSCCGVDTPPKQAREAVKISPQESWSRTGHISNLETKLRTVVEYIVNTAVLLLCLSYSMPCL
jgi:hypothetical protein